VWLASTGGAAGNGSLMRTAPLAVFFHDDRARRRDASRRDSAITRFDPRCQLACAAFNRAIAAAIGREPARTALHGQPSVWADRDHPTRMYALVPA
jgi:ADP-ribosylglycohydrolase